MRAQLARLRDAWRKFFFQPVPAVNLCLFRIFFGLVVLESAFLNLADVPTWYGVNGTLGREIVTNVLGSKCLDLLLFLPPTDSAVWSFYFVHIISAFCFTIGLFTRVSSIALYFTMSSLHFRNPVIINAGDDLMRVYSFFLMFSPAGATLSIDNLLRKRKPDSEHSKRGSEPAVAEDCTITPWTQRLIQLELTLAYFQYFWTKVGGNTWIDGTAVYYVLNNTTIEHFPWPLDRRNILVAKLLTWGTLVIEFFLWNLIWVKRFRYYVLFGGVLLHLGLEYTLNIPVFQHVILVSYILFVDPVHLKKILDFVRSKAYASGLLSRARPSDKSA